MSISAPVEMVDVKARPVSLARAAAPAGRPGGRIPFF
jgi:hypothetical protein